MVALIRSAARSARPGARLVQIGMMSAAAARGKHTLPPLPYAYNALEPYISAEIMTLHHTKHHQTYVNGLNAAEESLAKFTAAEDIKGILSLQAALKFNGGGHINHSLFWKNLAPASSSEAEAPNVRRAPHSDQQGLWLTRQAQGRDECQDCGYPGVRLGMARI